MEQQLAAGAGERQLAQLGGDGDVEAAELGRQRTGLAQTGFRLLAIRPWLETFYR